MGSRQLCSYFRCENSYAKLRDTNTHITFHHFPDNEDMLIKWVNACQNVNLLKLSRKKLRGKKVCSVHFSSWGSFINPLVNRNRKLKRDAVPEPCKIALDYNVIGMENGEFILESWSIRPPPDSPTRPVSPPHIGPLIIGESLEDPLRLDERDIGQTVSHSTEERNNLLKEKSFDRNGSGLNLCIAPEVMSRKFKSEINVYDEHSYPNFLCSAEDSPNEPLECEDNLYISSEEKKDKKLQVPQVFQDSTKETSNNEMISVMAVDEEQDKEIKGIEVVEGIVSSKNPSFGKIKKRRILNKNVQLAANDLGVNRPLRKKSIEKILNSLRGVVSETLFSLLCQELWNRDKDHQEWLQYVREFAIDIYFTSPECYKLLRRHFRLPSKTTIYRWVMS